RQLPRLHRRPGRAEAASPDTPAASAFSTPPLRRLWLPISVTTNLIMAFTENAGPVLSGPFFSRRHDLLPRRFPESLLSCIDLIKSSASRLNLSALAQH